MTEQEYLLILSWLNGYGAVDDHGLPITRFLDPQQDREARSLLSQALRSRDFHHQQLLNDLADLIDSSGEDDLQSPRMLVFRYRKQGNRLNLLRSSEIYFYLEDMLIAGVKLEAAVASAMEKYRLSRSEVFNAWTRHNWNLNITGPNTPDSAP